MGVTLRNHVTSHLMTKSVSGGAEGGVPSLHLMSKENRVLKTLHNIREHKYQDAYLWSALKR